jgi:PilZ domain/Arc-like DNA binding domain
MKKPVMFCMRMSQTMRDSLGDAAERDHRSVTSLLQKIIADYLEEKGFAVEHYAPDERRRFPRRKVTLPATTHLRAGRRVESVPGLVRDISLGGVLLSYPKGPRRKVPSVGGVPDFELGLQLPSTQEHIYFSCHARRMFDVGNEIQVGAAIGDADQENMQKLKSYLS